MKKQTEVVRLPILTLTERAELRGRIERYKNNLTRTMGERGEHFAWSAERVVGLLIDEIERERAAHAQLAGKAGT